MPAEELARVLVRYRETATKQLVSEEREEAEAREAREVAQTTIQMCSRILGELGTQDQST